jgi:hypothetical protein
LVHAAFKLGYDLSFEAWPGRRALAPFVTVVANGAVPVSVNGGVPMLRKRIIGIEGTGGGASNGSVPALGTVIFFHTILYLLWERTSPRICPGEGVASSVLIANP